MKRKTVIEIYDCGDTSEIFEKVQAALGMTFAHNLDALHDVLSEHGNGVTIIVKNGGKTPENVKKVFADLQSELSDFKAVFEEGGYKETKPDLGKPSSAKRLPRRESGSKHVAEGVG